jgi:dephospho-CoA kinase
VTVVGVTGGIASGKSAVLATLAELGAETIDADTVYHDLIVPGTELNRRLRAEFGEGIALPNGEIDRRALAGIVFADPAKLARLDALTHPAVIAEIERRIAAFSAPVVAVDAVKLFESGMDRVCDQVWLVVVDRERQIERLMARNSVTRAEAERRVDAQPIDPNKAERADAVIDNNGAPEETRAQVLRLWSMLPKSH